MPPLDSTLDELMPPLAFRLRFFFDAGAGTCLWADNDAGRKRFGYAVYLERLPVKDPLRKELARVVRWYDTSIDPSDPAGKPLWGTVERNQFEAHATEVLCELRQDFGPEFEVVDERDRD